MAEQPLEPLGVVVGRFQTPELTEGHKELLTQARAHAHRLVIIGVNPILGTKRNPLPAFQVERMIRAQISELSTTYFSTLGDVASDELWSQNLDAKIRELFPLTKARLYSGSDGFIKSYSGQFPVTTVKSVPGFRGTELREAVRSTTLASFDFRRGIIYASQVLPSVTRMAVDVAMTSNVPGVGPCVALIKKNSEPLYRFPGGLVDPHDLSLEAAAGRELSEELGGHGMTFAGPEYMVSAAINDWRFKGQPEGVQSALFWARHLFGPIKAGDDAHAGAWFALDEKTELSIMPEHRFFFQELLTFVRKYPGKTQLR